MNAFYFVSFNEPLELWLHAKKKGDGVAEDQRKQSADGPAAADEIQIYDTQRKRLFLPQWKTKWPWGNMKRKRV